MAKVFEIELKHGGGWSSIDRVDAINGHAPTKAEYLDILKDAGETALIAEVEAADDFRAIEV